MIEPRLYQVKVIAEFDGSVAANRKRVILVAPRSGKTIIAAAIVKATRAARRRDPGPGMTE